MFSLFDVAVTTKAYVLTAEYSVLLIGGALQEYVMLVLLHCTVTQKL